MRSIAGAPSPTNGRICFRCTSSVTDVPLRPTSRGICSIGTPSSDSRDTKPWRSYRARQAGGDAMSSSAVGSSL